MPRFLTFVFVLLPLLMSAQDSVTVTIGDQKPMYVCSPQHPESAGPCATPPRAKHTPDPKYPKDAKNAKLEGTVVLWLVVQEDGTPGNIKVARSLEKSLDEAAIEGVKKWKFEPGTYQGKAVPVQINVEVNFRLGSKEAGPPAPASYNETELGIKIKVPEGWTLTTQKPPTLSTPALAVFQKPGTLAAIALSRGHLEASSDLYKQLVNQSLDKHDDFRRLHDTPVTRDGIAGTRWEMTWTDKGIPQHVVLELFTVGDQHYRISAGAPEEVFSRYASDFESVFKSAQFPMLHAKTDDLLPSSK